MRKKERTLENEFQIQKPNEGIHRCIDIPTTIRNHGADFMTDTHNNDIRFVEFFFLYMASIQ